MQLAVVPFGLVATSLLPPDMSTSHLEPFCGGPLPVSGAAGTVSRIDMTDAMPA